MEGGQERVPHLVVGGVDMHKDLYLADVLD